jgi:hypothetical protein
MSSISFHTKSTIRLPKASNIRTMTPVPVYDVINFSDARTEKLGELLAKGHDTVAPLRDPKLILHSHLPHVCAVSYSMNTLLLPYSNELHTYKFNNSS